MSIIRTCLVDGKCGYFHRWMDYAQVVPPSLTGGGAPSGQIMETRAIVELEDGTIVTPFPYKVKFTDTAVYHMHCLTAD